MKLVLGGLLGLCVGACFAGRAGAQTIIEPVRYQYGQYSEVFYGGTNPALTSNNYGYLPEYMRGPYATSRADGVYPYPSPYMPYGPGTRFYSPYVQSMTIEYQSNRPLVFSDSWPYEEVGQFGFTKDDARNEAYSHVPRLQRGNGREAVPGAGSKGAQTRNTEAAPEAQQHATRESDPRLKAIPLLNWARAERTRNPALYKALLREARKYDAAATAAVEAEGSKGK